MRTAPAAKRAGAILRRLESLGDPANVAGMARYGIRSAKAFGVGAATIRRMAKACRRLVARDSAAARWVGRDALRELTDHQTVARIRGRSRV